MTFLSKLSNFKVHKGNISKRVYNRISCDKHTPIREIKINSNKKENKIDVFFKAFM